MALSQYLVDKSALVQASVSEDARRRLSGLFAQRQALTCSVIDLEILFSAKSASDWRAVFAERRTGFHRLDIDQSVLDRAIEVQGLLAEQGRHRAPSIPDLVVAACAEAHRVNLMHYDKDFEVISAVTGQSAEWITPRRRARG
ncbi:MAG: PIN domain-containing protein [Acidimicrobiia bacterium]|nr:PIN domain-containing protein [Acidimicrobiia bacterium]